MNSSERVALAIAYIAPRRCKRRSSFERLMHRNTTDYRTSLHCCSESPYSEFEHVRSTRVVLIFEFELLRLSSFNGLSHINYICRCLDLQFFELASCVSVVEGVVASSTCLGHSRALTSYRTMSRMASAFNATDRFKHVALDNEKRASLALQRATKGRHRSHQQWRKCCLVTQHS